jgi:hypothetical protein
MEKEWDVHRSLFVPDMRLQFDTDGIWTVSPSRLRSSLRSSRTDGGRAPECLLEAVAETALHSAAIVTGVGLAEERRFKNAASVRNIEVVQDVGATDIGDQYKMISRAD